MSTHSVCAHAVARCSLVVRCSQLVFVCLCVCASRLKAADERVIKLQHNCSHLESRLNETGAELAEVGQQWIATMEREVRDAHFALAVHVLMLMLMLNADADADADCDCDCECEGGARRDRPSPRAVVLRV